MHAFSAGISLAGKLSCGATLKVHSRLQEQDMSESSGTHGASFTARRDLSVRAFRPAVLDVFRNEYIPISVLFRMNKPRQRQAARPRTFHPSENTQARSPSFFLQARSPLNSTAKNHVVFLTGCDQTRTRGVRTSFVGLPTFRK